MSPAEVERIVLEQVDGQWDRWTPHGLDLRRAVVRPPRLETYHSHTSSGIVPLQLWLVVEEDPDTHKGYEVFYDSEENIFGLGSKDTTGRRHYIGGYGSLWDTLEGM